MLLGLFKEPVLKSVSFKAIAYVSLTSLLVIWHKMRSFPIKFAITSAGRRFALERSEKGKVTTTTSPFINRAMLRPLQGGSNLFPSSIRSILPFPGYHGLVFPLKIECNQKFRPKHYPEILSIPSRFDLFLKCKSPTKCIKTNAFKPIG